MIFSLLSVKNVTHAAKMNQQDWNCKYSCRLTEVDINMFSIINFVQL